MNEWWGYLHVNGSIQVKRVMWTYGDDIGDARSSPFVKRVIEKFPANSRQEAIEYIENLLSNEMDQR